MTGYMAQLAQQAAEAHSGAPFLEDGLGSLSFDEVLTSATRMANQIECDEGEPLLLFSGRDPDSYVAWIAGFLAGGVVCPMKKDTPGTEVQRLRELLGARTILNVPSDVEDQREIRKIVAGVRRDITISVKPEASRGPFADDVAYLVQTSGSSGPSKVVKVPERALMSYVEHVIPTFRYGAGARLSANFAMTFDLSVSDLVGAFVSGATLCLPRGAEHLTPRRYIETRALTHWYGTPSLTRTVSALREKTSGASECESIMFCGEQLFGRDVRWAQETAPAATVVNLYGPAELTLTCSQYEISPLDDHAKDDEPISAGWPYSHLEWSLGSDRSPRELMVRGPQMYAGYIRPTAEERAIEETEWYATGDNFNESKDGLLYAGRIDRQVKVFGVRIELAAVEQQIRTLADVRDVVVTQGADRRLIAFVSGSGVEPRHVERALRALPNEAVPSQVHVTSGDLPRNASGKIDVAMISKVKEEPGW